MAGRARTRRTRADAPSCISGDDHGTYREAERGGGDGVERSVQWVVERVADAGKGAQAWQYAIDERSERSTRQMDGEDTHRDTQGERARRGIDTHAVRDLRAIRTPDCVWFQILAA
jgi:hypothetical protein